MISSPLSGAAALCPNSTLTSRITAARKAIGDSGEQQALIRTVRARGCALWARSAAAGRRRRCLNSPRRPSGPRCRSRPGAQIGRPLSAPAGSPLLHQSDGTAVVGQGSPLVKTANWLNHLEYDWENPVWRPLFQAIAAEHQLIRYDARGNGLSDWDIRDFSFDAFGRDLETVVEAVGLKRFALFGISQGCAISIAYAVRYPEQVSHLILCGSFARGRKKRGSPIDSANSDAMVTLIRQENPAFRQCGIKKSEPLAVPASVPRSRGTNGFSRRLRVRIFGTADARAPRPPWHRWIAIPARQVAGGLVCWSEWPRHVRAVPSKLEPWSCTSVGPLSPATCSMIFPAAPDSLINRRARSLPTHVVSSASAARPPQAD